MKIYNEKAYYAYEKLVNGYNPDSIKRGFNNVSNGQFVQGAIDLASQQLENPFTAGSPEAAAFFQMRFCYGMWRYGGIDHKVNYIRMLRAAAELASMNIENPYDYLKPEEDVVSLEELAEEEIDTAVAEDVSSGTFALAANISKIFGVLPKKGVV